VERQSGWQACPPLPYFQTLWEKSSFGTRSALLPPQHGATFPRNLAPRFTHYLCEKPKEKNKTEEQPKFMNNQDPGSIIIMFLLLLPWLGRLGVSAIAAWRAYTEAQAKKAKQSL
jgi:hypothetical protein